MSDADEPQSRMTIGIVCALKIEVSPLLENCEEGRVQSGNDFKFRECHYEGVRIVIVEAGTGMDRARRATHALIDGCSPDWMLSIGFSGALKQGMQIGDIVVGNSICAANATEQLSVDIKMESGPHLHVGRLCTAMQIIRKVDDKITLGENTNALAVDMESLAVAQVCKERHVKFMVFRVISDDLTADLPSEVTALLGPKGTVRAGALIGTLWKRPNAIKDLWGMRSSAIKAATNLAKFTLSAIKNLR